MSIATEITRLQGAKADLKTAIEAKGVTVPSSTTIDGYATLVGQISGGGSTGPIIEKDVNFYDYDGTLVASYSAADFASLTALPSNPSHTGLTAQGWNWSLADAKTYVASYGGLHIGQMYTTSDGKTRIYLHIEAACTLPIYFSQTVANGVTVDWGDGSATTTASGTSNQTLTHSYAAGDYVLTMKATSGTYSWGQYFMGTSTNTGYQRYGSLVTKLEVGADVTEFYCYYWQRCQTLSVPSTTLIKGLNNSMSLRHITIPTGMTTLYSGMFSACYSMETIAIPKTITSYQSCFSNNYSLRIIYLPSSITSSSGINYSIMYALQKVVTPVAITYSTSPYSNCKSITKVDLSTTTLTEAKMSYCDSLQVLKLPSTITTVSQYAYSGAYGLRELYIYATTPPTLANTNAFSNVDTANLKIYVPSASVATYKAASGWSNYASNIQAIPS